MQALGLDVKVLSEDSQEIHIRESSEFDGAMDFRTVLNRDKAERDRAREAEEARAAEEEEIITEYEDELEDELVEYAEDDDVNEADAAEEEMIEEEDDE